MAEVKTEIKKPAAAAHGATGHGDDHGASEGGGLKEMGKATLWFVAIIFVIAFAILIVVINPDTAQTFVYFVNALQVFLAFVIIFSIYKIQVFRHRYDGRVHDVMHLFQEKNGQGHNEHEGEHGHDSHHDKKPKAPTNIFEERLEKAKGHVNSPQKEEWKTGLIELDNLMRDLLIKKNYEGGNLNEILENAKEKNYKYADDAIMCHKTKNFLLKNLIKSPEEKEGKTFKNLMTLYVKIIADLMH